jgi:redox-sensitive bicupin YhaK (pirin superfamily)
MTLKTVLRQHKALRDDIGDLVTRRPIPGPAVDQIDPFLFLNHHGPQIYRPGNQGLPFGPHPHRGFETLTFILQGELAHLDTAGHESIIRAGGVQWMTAGRGLVHAEISPEDFKRSGGPLEILQLWINLPARLKMTAPRYIGLQGSEIPIIESDDGRTRLHLISGEWNGAAGPIKSLTGVFASTIEMKEDASFTLAGLERRNVFLYTVHGLIGVGGTQVPEFTLAELSEAGDTLTIEAATESTVLLCHGEPIGEPVVSYGPFVMNSQQEIRDAIADYQAGKFFASVQ